MGTTNHQKLQIHTTPTVLPLDETIVPLQDWQITFTGILIGKENMKKDCVYICKKIAWHSSKTDNG